MFCSKEKVALSSFKTLSVWVLFFKNILKMKYVVEKNKSYRKVLYVCFQLTFIGKAKQGNSFPSLFFQFLYSFNLNSFIKRRFCLFVSILKRIEDDCVAYIRTYNIFVSHNGKKIKLGPKKAFLVFS